MAEPIPPEEDGSSSPEAAEAWRQYIEDYRTWRAQEYRKKYYEQKVLRPRQLRKLEELIRKYPVEARHILEATGAYE